MKIFKNKSIIVFGGTGSIGSELVKQLLTFKPKSIRIFARDETKHEELLAQLKYSPLLRSLIGDVRDKDRVRHAMRNVDIAFNASGLKAVSYCEYNPMEAVNTNVYGTQNIIQAAIEENIEKVITISTDKAAEPVNTMGATKLLAERLTAAAYHYSGKKRPVFMAVRFGNVLGSRNSILPLIKKQILNGGPVSLTDPKMTRFIMSIPDAVKLVLNSAELGRGGEVFILKMPAVYIKDLIDVYISLIADNHGLDSKKIKIKNIGIRLGEKLDEKLLSYSEAQNTYENDKLFMILSNIDKPNEPAQRKKYPGFKLLKDSIQYDTASIKKINQEEIKKVLLQANLV
jgi:UDP-N-acetylglucosamine 4,6-dehydratase/5-epimerase